MSKIVHSDIPGWFDFHQIYLDAIKAAPQEGAVFVELGSFLGQSTAFMADAIKKSGKKITFYAVDLFKVDPKNDHNSLIEPHASDIFPLFLKNMEDAGVSEFVTPMQCSTSDAAVEFIKENVKFDFVFIDANHTYPFVNADIKAYLPLTKEGGVIAGHDIYFKDVKRAVMHNFGKNYKVTPSCWIHDKSKYNNLKK